MNVPDRVRLPLHFDAAVLAEEVAALPEGAWVPHFNTAVYKGEWSGVALRAVGGVADRLYPDPVPKEPFADTPWLGRCPRLASALAEFCCPVTSARLLSLAPGAVINEHKDYRLGWEDGEIRVHVALSTDDDVEFVLDDRRVTLAPGDAWYLNVNRRHRVANRSPITRIHLVVDCVVDEWLTEQMRSALAGPPPVPAP